MTEALIFDAVRTPRASARRGALRGVKPIALAAGALRALADRNHLDGPEIDDVVLGCVSPVGEQGADIARIAALTAGLDLDTPGVQVDRFCASGLEAANLAAMKIRSGFEDLVVAGGIESMSRVPMGSTGGAWMDDPETALRTGYVPQGVAIDLLATLEGFTREDLDGYALLSHQRAARARDEGRFGRSLVPVTGTGGATILDIDDAIRPDTTAAALAALKPSFAGPGEQGYDAVAIDRHPDVERVEHLHTAGNSSQIVDGAAAMLIGNAAAGERLGLTPAPGSWPAPSSAPSRR